jgi:hypothetical protein
MAAAKVTWIVVRVLRYAMWIGFFCYSFYVSTFRASVVNQFGHLPPEFELPIFGLAMAAVTLGFLELMMRERAGIARPPYFSFGDHPLNFWWWLPF